MSLLYTESCNCLCVLFWWGFFFGGGGGGGEGSVCFFWLVVCFLFCFVLVLELIGDICQGMKAIRYAVPASLYL